MIVLLLFYFLPSVESGQEWHNYWITSGESDKYRDSVKLKRYIEKIYPFNSGIDNHEREDVINDIYREFFQNRSGFLYRDMADKYVKSGFLDIENGNRDEARTKLCFATKLDPSNAEIPLILLKLDFPNIKKLFSDFKKYIGTFKYIQRKYSFIRSSLISLVFMSGMIILSVVISGFISSVQYISKFVEERFNINGLWFPAIFFALFVWIPVSIFLLLMVAISFLKMKKTPLFLLIIALILFPLFIGYYKNIHSNFSTDSPYYREIISRYYPNRTNIKEPVTPYGYLVKGIEEALGKRYSRARTMFENGYERKKSTLFLVNMASLNYGMGRIESSIKLCDKVLESDRNNAIANLTMANIFLNKLEFDRASKYLDRINEDAPGVAEQKFPIYKYPPDRWLYSYVFSTSGLFQIIKDSRLKFFWLLAVFLIILFFIKSGRDNYCEVCNRYIIDRQEIDELELCSHCARRLWKTNSKAIRERLKRKIGKLSSRIDLIRDLIMNLIFPGSAHFNKKKAREGLLFSAGYGFLIYVFILNKFSSSSYLTGRISGVGINIFYVLIGIFYLVLIIKTWRLKDYGNAGEHSGILSS